jgi:ribosomal protein S18 acetylase RimI-like enzyme
MDYRGLMMHFEPITEKEFQDYWRYSVESWIRDMGRAGFLREDITFEEAEKEVRKFIPDGLSTEGHHIMHIMDNGNAVGTIWYEIRDRAMREAYLWDIFIDEDQRGRGYGKEAMRELERTARKEGARRIQLNVFGFNSVARNLYVKTGYQDAAVTMMKHL